MLTHIQNQGLPFVFTNKHAYYAWADFYTDLADLDQIDWPILQQRDFKRDPDDPEKFERYQAEALIHQHCPISALLGIVCFTQPQKNNIEQLLAQRGMGLAVDARPGWYF